MKTIFTIKEAIQNAFCKQSDFKAWDALESRLIDDLDHRIDQEVFFDTQVALVAFDSENLQIIKQHVARLGIKNITVASDLGVLKTLFARDLKITHVFINFESFKDALSGVDELILFRKSAPDWKIVLCTTSVRGDSFDSHRKSICDVTLSLPVKFCSLTQVFSLDSLDLAASNTRRT
jgi:hypothetical protein